MRIQDKALIDGAWVSANSGKTIAVTDPATDEVVANVPDMGEQETRRAIDAAARSQPAWAGLTAFERGKLLRKMSELMLARQEDLGRLLTREQGKPLAEAKGEIAYAASFIDWAAEEGKRLYGETIPASSADKRILVLRQPVGVTASITPWNFPAAMITRKLGPALASGCTMVIKPAELTPLSALALGEIALEAGIPPGVVNIVTGDARAIGGALFSTPIVRKISFTGSTEVGRILVRQSADNMIRLSLELGGHAPFIVFDDADIPAAVKGAIASKYRNAGQTCVCANRFIVHEKVADEFARGLADEAKKLRVGRGTDEGVAIGPLINDEAMEKVERHVDDARSGGASALAGGTRARISGLADRFYQPTVLTGVRRDALCFREETFGPVSPVTTFRQDDEAVEIANDSEFGLASYFYTRSASRLMRVAEALRYGIVGANDGAPSTAQAPFGGVKQSGFGREGGKYVMHEYTEIKYVSWGI